MTHYLEDQSEWAEEVGLAWRQHILTLWRVADLLVAGIEAFTDGSADQVAELLSSMAEQLEREPKTLENYVTVARRFPEDKRFRPHGAEPLSLGHHALLTKYSDEVAMGWLQRAWAEGWGEGKLRMQLRLAADREDPDSEEVVPPDLAIERQFYRMGVRAKLAKRQCTFETPAGTLVVSSQSDMTWSLRDR